MSLCNKAALRIRIVLVILPVLFTGCGGGASLSSTSVLTPRFAFVANFISGDVSAFTINASTGALTAVGSPVAVGTNPISMAVDPGGRFAYVANATSNDISAFTINATTGALTAVGPPVAAGTGPVSVTVDPTGTFAYVANRFSDDVSAFTINASTGALTAVGPPVAGGSSPQSVISVGKLQ